jgi:hypothetical protein
MNKLSACDGHVAKLVHPASSNAATPSRRTLCVTHGCGNRTAAAADAAGPVAQILILSPAAGGPALIVSSELGCAKRNINEIRDGCCIVGPISR